MSKIGQKPISIPTGVEVSLSDVANKKETLVKIKGKNGEMAIRVPRLLMVKKDGDFLVVTRRSETGKAKSFHGLFRSLIANAIIGVEKLWRKELMIVGTGYTVKSQGEDLVFKLGYSHLITFKKVVGIKFRVEGTNKVIVEGFDKQLVGETAYQIKNLRKPDPYKGKGIRYQGEVVKLKAGKKAKTGPTA